MGRAWLIATACLFAVVPSEANTAAPVVAPPDDGTGMWGVGLGAWPTEARRRGFSFPPDLEEVRALGANHVLIPVTLEQETIVASHVGRGSETITDHDLTDLIRAAHRARLRVTLMPLIEVRHGKPHHWRGVLDPTGPAAWWQTYADAVAHYAEIASREDVATLVIGSELSSLSGAEHAARWQAIAEIARERFSGPLAWVSNHDATHRRAALPFVDIAGVSAYYPLANDLDATPAMLEARFRATAAALAKYQAEIDMPLVLFEVGFPSVDGGAMRPWDYTTGAPIDLEEQRAAYAAVAAVLTEARFIDGALFWGWFGPGGPHDRYYTPRQKPAEAELARLLVARRGLALASSR